MQTIRGIWSQKMIIIYKSVVKQGYLFKVHFQCKNIHIWMTSRDMDTIGTERAWNLRYRGYLEKTTSNLMLKV